MSDSAGLLWSILLLTVVGVGALLVFTVAWAYRRHGRTETRSAAFSIQDLREMRDSGAISEAEYNTLRAAMLEKARGDDDGAPDGAGPLNAPEHKNGDNVP